MGGGSHHRLFCNFKKILLQYVSAGSIYRLSMPGVRAYQGGNGSIVIRFRRSLSDASLYLSADGADSDVPGEPVSSWKEKDAGFKSVPDGDAGRHDYILCVEDVPVFSGGAAYELLWWKLAEETFPKGAES